jgi:predicted metal-binding membrane protein
MTAHDQQLSNFMPAVSEADGVAAAYDRAMSRPVVVALLSVAALSGIGWIYLGLMATPVPGSYGAIIDLLCRPALNQSSIADTGLVLAMWCAMVLAMMLPTAGPMIVTYAEIADTAARKGDRIVSPLVLTVGYLTVWLVFAVAATALQMALTHVAQLDPAMRVTSPLSAGAILVGAGAYQFSALKHACVTRCQRPFPFFFANWTSQASGVFWLGLRQGLYCLGCCWAMMLVMFAVGAMNVAWMAALGLVMGMEKLAATTRVSHAAGLALIVSGCIMLVVA